MVTVKDEFEIRAQRLGGSVALWVTRSPAPTDDIDWSVGEGIIAKARGLGMRDAILIDAHNVAVKKKGVVREGTPEAKYLAETAEKASDWAEKAQKQ